jgi:isopenicillin N synthase-like dioxygenase
MKAVFDEWLLRYFTDLLTNAESFYNLGWSHGKEALKSGQYDTLKGSYYVGVMSSQVSAACKDSSQNKALLELPNIWPSESVLPGFRETFEDLCSMIFDIALLVSRACDQFVEMRFKGYEPGLLQRMLKESTASRARLLHYFPPLLSSLEPVITSEANLEDEDTWCAVHVDDGCLTGLTSALFVDESLPLPSISSTSIENAAKGGSIDPNAGLYILSRTKKVVKVNIPADCLAFQTGSALELMTGGALKAVPHFVRGPSANVSGSKLIARNTLAVFTQPNMGEVVDRESGLTFGEHTRISDENHA